MLIRGTVVAVAMAVLSAAAPTRAQVAVPKTEPLPQLTFAQIGLSIHPAKGQTADQQKKDEDACYEWAEANTGLTLVPGDVDVLAAGQAAARGAGQGKVAKGAAKGAARGVAIGVITGNPAGVAVGAVAGSLGGLRGKINAKKSAGRQGAQQAVQANQQQVEQFKKAAEACLEPRGYSVRSQEVSGGERDR